MSLQRNSYLHQKAHRCALYPFDQHLHSHDFTDPRLKIFAEVTLHDDFVNSSSDITFKNVTVAEGSSMYTSGTLLLICWLWGVDPPIQSAQPKQDTVLKEIPPDVRKEFQLDAFYRKAVLVGGLPIVSSEKVEDDALLEAAWIVRHMLEGRDDLITAIAQQHVRIAIMAANEFTTDIPEHRHLESKVFWDRRARGLGATLTALATSCGAENLLEYPGDPYAGENILIHEFAHTIHGVGMKRLSPSFDARLKAAFDAAKLKGLWKGTYAGTNHSEYWAEGVQSWFDDNAENDALHNHVDTRVELLQYDAKLASLCQEVFGDRSWRYLKPTKRPAADRKHLKETIFLNGVIKSSRPTFQWREAPIGTKPRVLIQTEVGDLEVELDSQRAPMTTANFLRYVHLGYYSNGLFHRTVRSDNQPKSPSKIQVIQASANPKKAKSLLPAILLERTDRTGVRHVSGAISMARDGPDTAQDEFFICVQAEPELDFAGRRNPDGQGFAAFGRVVKGMDVVEKIQKMPAKEQTLEPPVRIQRLIRLN